LKEDSTPDPHKINQNSNSNITKLYPSPCSDKITIETTGKSHLSISNLRGQELLHQETIEPITTINVNTLPNGVYF
jgi:hypothetical protein